MSRALSFSLVILTHNRRASVRSLLEAMVHLRPLLQEVIVIDNCSADGTGDMLRTDFPEVITHSTDRNLGACARDIGIRKSTADVVITLDDDILGLSPGHIDWLDDALSSDPSLGAINFRVVDAKTGAVGNWVHHRPVKDAESRFSTFEITEGAVAMRRQAYLEAGGYYIDYFIGHEGPDLAYRLMNAGYQVVYDGSVTVKHTFAEEGRVPWRPYYYDTRNQFWLAARNMPWSHATRYLATGLASMGFYALRDGFFIWYLRGIRDGVIGLSRASRTREVWTKNTERLIREIDRFRPGFWTQVKQSLKKSPTRLDG